jgi:hypothetical protein
VKTRAARLLVLAQLLWMLGPHSAARASAAGGVTFTVGVQSAFLHAEPSLSAERTYSVFQGQTYGVTGRTADGTWVSLDFATATAGTWIRAGLGTVSGYLDFVPVPDTALAAVPADVSSPSVAPASDQAPAGTGASSLMGIPGKTLNLTITTASLFARDAPDPNANRVASIFRGQHYLAVQRDPNAKWLQIVLFGAELVWVPAGAGQLDGNILDLPQPGENLPLLPPEPDYGPAPSTPLPAWIPAITPHMRDVYAQATQHERDKRVFAIAGDCNSLSYYYLALVAKNLIDLQGNDYLGNTIEEFKSSFFRTSVAVAGGFNAASVLDPAWSNPRVCKSGESPFACELRLSQASIVFIALGTGDQFDWRNFDTNYRRLISFALDNGVLPVLVTKADALESQEGGAPPDFINDDIRALAKEYDVPLMDFGAATAELPNHGLLNEPGDDFHLSGAGMGVHVISTLQTLDVIWRSVRAFN